MDSILGIHIKMTQKLRFYIYSRVRNPKSMSFTFCALISLVLLKIVSCCPTGTMQGLNPDDCYQFVPESKTWDDAEYNCIERGGHLAKVSNNEENNFLQKNFLQPLYCYSYVWLGGVLTSDGWRWYDGSTMDFTAWSIDQPSTKGDALLFSKYKNGSWFGYNRASSFPYICKIDKNSTNLSSSTLKPTAVMRGCPEGYVYFNVTNYCYKKFFDDFFNFTIAEARCSQDGGHLVSIHSYSENNFIGATFKDIFAFGKLLWVGVYFKNKVVAWTDGSMVDFQYFRGIAEFGYGPWCAYMNLNHENQWRLQWQGAYCNSTMGFICKRTPIP